ncbi:MAG: Asp-tRNA(Asn)/Glu-tRNA(Gln) amidotransferase subunit GatC [Myxococcota bacterium]
MTITAEAVRGLARLAQLDLSQGEVEAMRRDLEAILEYVALLDELDTDDVPVTSHGIDAATPLRPDRVDHVLPRDEVLRNSPRHDGESLVVPRVLE